MTSTSTSAAITLPCSEPTTKTLTLTSQSLLEAFIEHLRRLDTPVDGVVYEAGPTGFGLAHALLEEEITVTVAAPSKIPRSVSAGTKTDHLTLTGEGNLAIILGYMRKHFDMKFDK